MTALLSDPVDIAVVDYGMGNRRSVEKALERVGASACVTSDAGRLRAAAGLVVPGVGSFPRAMANLRELRLDELLLERVAGGTPVLGVCLGMQLAFERSSEHGGSEGLGILAGEVRELRAGSRKRPHIGWNRPVRALRLLPRALLRGRAGALAGRAGCLRVRRAVRERRRQGFLLRRAVSPGEVIRRRAAPARKLRTHLCCRAHAQQPVRLYPAIDILDGNAVRLLRGDFDAKTIYESDPLAAARAWVQAGARHLHVVDLDGARGGEPVNLAHLRRISGELDVVVQYGGGLRSAAAVRDALRAGAARVVLGTAAFADTGLLEEALGAHGPERVLVSVDARGGRVATSGWTDRTDLGALDALASLQRRGVERFVFTDVDRDGMLEGPRLEEVRRLAAAVEGTLVYSGGIGRLRDLEGLARLGAPNIDGVIVGKALYERRFTVAEAQQALAA